jgi:hypothetical protein
MKGNKMLELLATVVWAVIVIWGCKKLSDHNIKHSPLRRKP